MRERREGYQFITWEDRRQAFARKSPLDFIPKETEDLYSNSAKLKCTVAGEFLIKKLVYVWKEELTLICVLADL